MEQPRAHQPPNARATPKIYSLLNSISGGTRKNALFCGALYVS
jgi:hypothetical protein